MQQAPRNKAGGFVTVVYAKEDGQSTEKVLIRGYVMRGILQLGIKVAGHDTITLEVNP
jgi:hypothetical protein